MKAAGIFEVGNHLLIPRYTLIWPRRMAVKDTGSPRSGWPSVLKIHSTTVGVTQCPFDKVMMIHNALVLNLERGQHPYLHSQSHWQNSITAISVLFTCFGLFAYFSCVSLICWSISFVFTGLAYSNVIWTVVYVMELIIPVSKEVMFACLECIFRSDVLLRSSCHIHLAYFSGEDTERFFFIGRMCCMCVRWKGGVWRCCWIIWNSQQQVMPYGITWLNWKEFISVDSPKYQHVKPYYKTCMYICVRTRLCALCLLTWVFIHRNTSSVSCYGCSVQWPLGVAWGVTCVST